MRLKSNENNITETNVISHFKQDIKYKIFLKNIKKKEFLLSVIIISIV